MTMRNIILAASVAAALGLPPAALAQSQGEGASMQNGSAQVDSLRGAAIALRDALSGLADEAPGQWRDKATDQATDALHATNNAIAALSAGYRDEKAKAKEREKASSQQAHASNRQQASNVQQASNLQQASNGQQVSSGKPGEARQLASNEQPQVSSDQQGNNGDEAAATSRSEAVPAVPQGEGEYALLVVPSGATLDSEVANGCWARVYSDTNFRGTAVTFVGNVEVPGLNSPLGSDHESLIVGPGAALVANSPQQTITIHPNQRLADLHSTQPDNMFGTLRSVRLACVG